MLIASILQTKELRPEQLSVLIKITQPLSDSQDPESTLLTALPCYPVMPTHQTDFIDPQSPRSSQWLLLPSLSPITHTHTYTHSVSPHSLSHTHPLLQPYPTISGNSVHPVFTIRPLHRLSSPSGMPFPLSLTWPALSSLPIHHHLQHPGHTVDAKWHALKE